jgi:SsrA-binding protein
MPAGRKLIVDNRKARHDFHILERVEAGVALTGTEVKSLREGGGNLREAYAQLHDGEVFLVGAHIAPYRQGNLQNHEPMRDRKLLLHRREIERLTGRVAERGLTLVPTRMYFSGPRSMAKVEIALAKGKDLYDKRQAIKSRDTAREVQRELREVGR